MTFLNLFMLFGAAAASIPLIIHLLNRSKYEIVDWGAMHLLQAVIEENNRRIKIYEFLLLLIRCLIPIILALCLARPLVNQFTLGGSSSSTQTLVILDDSVSMAHLDGSEATRLQRASGIVENLRDQLGNPASLRVVPDLLTTPKPAYSGSFDLRQNILDALDLASKERSTAFEIVVVSDFQQSAFSGLDESAKREIAAKLESVPLRPAISLLPVEIDATDASKTNVRIYNLVVDSQRVVLGETTGITAELTNEGSQGLDDLTVELLLDGETITKQQVQLSPKASGPIGFDLPIDTQTVAAQKLAPGSTADCLLTVRCQLADDCEVDNQAHQVLSIVSPIRAAVVTKLGRSTLERDEGKQNENGSEAASEFLMVALSPYAFAGDGETQTDRISAVRVNGKRLRLEDLSNVDVLILTDPAELNQEVVDQITNFVMQGGGLLVFSGPRSEAATESLNQMITGETAGWIQGRLTSMELGLTDGTEGSEEPSAKFQSSRFVHPTMQLFNESDGAGIKDATFKKWLKLENLGEESLTIASFSNSLPFAVETQVGLGTVIFCTTSADTTWSNLPLRPAYLPLVQRLVEYLAFRGQPSKNQAAGSPALFRISDSVSLAEMQVVTPSGRIVPVREADVQEPVLSSSSEDATPRIAFSDTREVGVYRLMHAESPETEQKTDDQGVQLFVSTFIPEELSSPTSSEEQLLVFAEQYQFNHATNVEQYFAGRFERAMGFEVWYWIWWGVLGLMVAERLVVWMMGRIT